MGWWVSGAAATAACPDHSADIKVVSISLTNLSAACKYAILGAQFVLFSRIITDRGNFCEECALILVELAQRGYRRTCLWRTLDTLLARHSRRLFGDAPASLVLDTLSLIATHATARGGINGLDTWGRALE
mgnify:CR=1 FL=1